MMITLPMSDIPQSRLSASVDAARAAVSKTSQIGDATYMPSDRQTSYGLKNLVQVEKIYPEQNHINLPSIRSKRGSPSAITAENVLRAKASLDEIYVHNISSMRREYISNLHSDAPKFSNQFDMMA